MSATQAVLIEELRAAVSTGCRVVDDPDLTARFRQDQTTVVRGGLPLAVVWPACLEDVVAAMRWASRHRIPVVPRGSGTSLAGGASGIEGGLVVCTSAMRRIRKLSPQDRVAVVEAGVITADVDRAAREHGLMYAPDPSSHEISTIGGNAATNAGGLRCVKYGVTRQSVLGLEVVLSDGRVLTTGGHTVKDVAGYDLTGLFVGSEGTLGVITAVTVRLRPAPAADPVTVAASFPTMRAAGEAVAHIVEARLEPSLLELLDRPTLVAIDEMTSMGLAEHDALLIAQADTNDAAEVAQALAGICSGHGAHDVVVSTDSAESKQLLDVRRLAYPAAERRGTCLVEDVGVPVAQLPRMLERIAAIAARHQVTVMTVAHAGDGNLHPTFVFDPAASQNGDIPPPVRAAAAEVFRAAVELGGTITGEHGVGVLKRDWLRHQVGDVAMDVSRAIRDAVDPLGIMNPGKVLPPLEAPRD